jgi:Acetyltransferase (GNAT) domain
VQTFKQNIDVRQTIFQQENGLGYFPYPNRGMVITQSPCYTVKMEETDLHVSLNALPPIAELAAIWQTLQTQSDHSFFTSWAWVGCWLHVLPKNLSPLLLKAERAGKIVGAGIVVAKERSRLRLFKTPALYLHTTGDPYFDEITIEYNSFLAERSIAPQIVKQFLGFLFSGHEHRCDEIFIDGSTHAHNLRGIAPAGTRILVPRLRGCYSVDLDQLRLSGQEYINTLGPSRRYSIRRTMRKYAAVGPLNMTVAGSVAEAVFFLGELRQLHQAYWGKKGSAGAFANPFFNEFINRLTSTQFANGNIQLLRVRAGDRVIGYLLNFVYQGHVYQYQSGFDYHVCDKYNGPGYVCHLFGVEHNVKSGHHKYDYMAGDSEYKKAMGEPDGELSWQIIQRERLGFRIEDRVRHVVRSLKNLSKNRKFLRSNGA